MDEVRGRTIAQERASEMLRKRDKMPNGRTDTFRITREEFLEWLDEQGSAPLGVPFMKKEIGGVLDNPVKREQLAGVLSDTREEIFVEEHGYMDYIIHFVDDHNYWFSVSPGSPAFGMLRSYHLQRSERAGHPPKPI
jgi:hypothetical protein